MLCERVQKGVGGSIGALVSASPDAGDGGKDDEGVERLPAEQVVEVLSTCELAAGDVGELGQGCLGYRRRLDYPSRVDDRIKGGTVGLKLLAIKDVRVGNFLPALVIAPLIVWLLAR